MLEKYFLFWPSNWFRRLADASQPLLKMPGKQCFCSIACPWPFNRGMRSPSKSQCPPNESPLQLLTLFFNIYAHRLCAGGHKNNNNNNNMHCPFLIRRTSMSFVDSVMLLNYCTAILKTSKTRANFVFCTNSAFFYFSTKLENAFYTFVYNEQSAKQNLRLVYS